MLRLEHFPEKSIRNYIDFMSPKIRLASCVLISCLDSSRNVAELTTGQRLVAEHGATAGPAGALLMSGEKLLSVSRIFNGFDEVWLCESAPAEPQPKFSFIVSPGVGDLSLLGEWMSRNGVTVGLGDGCGLNLVGFDLTMWEPPW